MTQILSQHRTVQRADNLNIQRCCHLEQSLHLRTVLADDADVIAACLTVPIFLYIQCAKLAEAVCREQNLIGSIICDHNFRPMYHRSENKRQRMAAQLQGSLIGNNLAVRRNVCPKELLHHNEGLCIAYDNCIRIHLQKFCDACRMIRLHVLYYEIGRLLAVQRLCDIVQPLLCEMDVYRVHDGNLVVQNHIGIVRHAIRYHILSLEQIYLVVVDTDIQNAVCYLTKCHCSFLPS